MTDILRAISDWGLSYGLGCAVLHIIRSQKTGKNEELRSAIKFLEKEIEFNEKHELERFKGFADYMSKHPEEFCKTTTSPSPEE